MASEKSPLVTASKGVYIPAGPNDARGPCPVINSLANHGYISRSGKNVRAGEIASALSTIGLSRTLRTALSYPVFNERLESQQQIKKLTFFQKLWNFLRNPWSILAHLGVRRPFQEDDRGRKVINLDQLALYGAVEHDVSLTRRDFKQKEGNCIMQPDLVRQLLESSKDGKKITMQDLADLRKTRINQQTLDNPELKYGESQHTLACGEIALILSVFGDGKSISCDRARALFQEERLPVEEGWKRRWWWSVGLFEIHSLGDRVKAAVGLKFPASN